MRPLDSGKWREECAPEFVAAVDAAVGTFLALDCMFHVDAPDEAGRVHHLWPITLGEWAGLWAVDDFHAEAIAGSLTRLLGVLTADEYLDNEDYAPAFYFDVAEDALCEPKADA